jgi:insulysin
MHPPLSHFPLSLLFHPFSYSPPLPPPTEQYDEKSLDYICTLLSNQHKGSLYSYLKHKGWVLHMDAGVGIGNHEFDVIQITARLTESGLVRPAALLSAIYGYLRLMREKGVEEWRFNEMKKIAEIDFSMKSKERPIRYVSKLARLVTPTTHCPPLPQTAL